MPLVEHEDIDVDVAFRLAFSARLGQEKTALHCQIDAVDHQIDQSVYELHGLTEKEIEIVEGGG